MIGFTNILYFVFVSIYVVLMWTPRLVTDRQLPCTSPAASVISNSGMFKIDLLIKYIIALIQLNDSIIHVFKVNYHENCY